MTGLLVTRAQKRFAITLKAPLLKAALSGAKTQTRRVVALPIGFEFDGFRLGEPAPQALASRPTEPTGTRTIACPYRVGDRLWVREPWACLGGEEALYQKEPSAVFYRADFQDGEVERIGLELRVTLDHPPGGRWRAACEMPPWASRLTLEVTALRAQRVQEISEHDARAEGVAALDGLLDETALCRRARAMREPVDSSRVWFAEWWDSLEGRGAWAKNPPVWVVTFRRRA